MWVYDEHLMLATFLWYAVPSALFAAAVYYFEKC